MKHYKSNIRLAGSVDFNASIINSELPMYVTRRMRCGIQAESEREGLVFMR